MKKIDMDAVLVRLVSDLVQSLADQLETGRLCSRRKLIFTGCWP
jgi:hypothetical protein